jgi:NAD-dependent deacetylase
MLICDIKTDAQYLVNKRNICILTGAGTSAESGIATFRGPQGLWVKYRPEELATPQAFAADPHLVWKWYQYRREIISGAKPNAGHIALARWEEIAPTFTIITQNVDGLHQQAGNRHVLELHGNIRTNRCVSCDIMSSMDKITYNGEIPRCECGGILRPAIVWFGEELPQAVLRDAYAAVQNCDLFLTVGTSAVVYPAAVLPEMAAKYGIPVLEINPEDTPFSSKASCCLRGTAGQILPQLVDAYAAVNQG